MDKLSVNYQIEKEGKSYIFCIFSQINGKLIRVSKKVKKISYILRFQFSIISLNHLSYTILLLRRIKFHSAAVCRTIRNNVSHRVLPMYTKFHLIKIILLLGFSPHCILNHVIIIRNNVSHSMTR